MAELAVRNVAGNLAKATAREILYRFRGEYDEQLVKERILQKLDLLKDHLEALRNKEFKTALEQLKCWALSRGDLNSEMNIMILNQIREKSSEAAQNVKEPIDKIRAYTMNAYAMYHLQASLELKEGKSEEESFRSAKRVAQNVLKVVLELDFVRSACDVENGRSIAWIFRSNTSRRALLAEIVSLSQCIWQLPPYDENANHPRDQLLCEAVTRLVKDGSVHIWDAPVGHMLPGIELKTLRGHSYDVLCLTVFDGDSKAISGSYDKTLKVWSLPSEFGEKQRVICSHGQSLAESNDDTLEIEFNSGIEPVFEIGSTSEIEPVFETEKTTCECSWW